MIKRFNNFINEAKEESVEKKYQNASKEDKKVMNLIKSSLKGEAKNFDLYEDGNNQVLFFDVNDQPYKLTLKKEKKKK